MSQEVRSEEGFTEILNYWHTDRSLAKREVQQSLDP